MSQLVEVDTGVCPFITIPEDQERGFLAIKEARWKRSSRKLAGMIAPPFETLNQDESHKDGLIRSFQKEELTVLEGEVQIPDNLTSAKFCIVQLSPGVVLHVYSLFASADIILGQGSEDDVLDPPFWVPFSEVLESETRDPLRFRPGVLEIVKSYLDFKKSKLLEPTIFLKTAFSVPGAVYDLLETGLSQTEALSRLHLGNL